MKLASDQVSLILGDLAALQSNRTLYLLNEPAVQKKLQLSESQQEQLGTLFMRGRGPNREQGAQTVEEHEQQAVEAARANEAAVEAILDSEQFVRLKQIGYRVEGSMAFRNLQVVTALELTAERRSRIRRIMDERPGRERYRHNLVPQDKLDEILLELTPEQRTTWTELIGEPFAGLYKVRSFDRSGPPREPRR